MYADRMFFSKRKKRNPVCAIWWRDAAYSYDEQMPAEIPPVQVTTGFVVHATGDFTNIAVNVNYNLKKNTLWQVDGFIIPEKAIIKFKKIGWLI
jgi:hypothetical protein